MIRAVQAVAEKVAETVFTAGVLGEVGSIPKDAWLDIARAAAELNRAALEALGDATSRAEGCTLWSGRPWSLGGGRSDPLAWACSVPGDRAILTHFRVAGQGNCRLAIAKPRS